MSFRKKLPRSSSTLSAPADLGGVSPLIVLPSNDGGVNIEIVQEMNPTLPRAFPSQPSAFCEKTSKIVEMVGNLLGKERPSINADFWVEINRQIATLYTLCQTAIQTCEDEALEAAVRKLINSDRPWFSKYNVLYDKLKLVIQEVDDPTAPLEIHRYAEQKLEAKDEQINELSAKVRELEDKLGQANDKIRDLETSHAHAQAISTLNQLESLKRKILEDARNFDVRLKQTEERYSSELQDMTRKYQEIMKEYRKLLEQHHSEYERNANMFLQHQGSVENHVVHLNDQYTKTLEKKNQMVENLQEELEYLKRTLQEREEANEVTITKQAHAIAQHAFRIKQLEKKIAEQQQLLDMKKLSEDPAPPSHYPQGGSETNKYYKSTLHSTPYSEAPYTPTQIRDDPIQSSNGSMYYMNGSASPYSKSGYVTPPSRDGYTPYERKSLYALD